MRGRQTRIGIIGGGCSGVMLAVHLARSATTPTTIHLIERAPLYGRGVAYATAHPLHLLNAPVSRMSAFEDDPTHFLRWLRRTSPPCTSWTGCEFVPRSRYGHYLEDLLVTGLRSRDSRAAIELLSGNAIAIEHGRDELAIVLEDGARLAVDRAVLCTGFSRSKAPVAGCGALRAAPRFIADPWDDAQRNRIAPGDNLLVVGTGLTMVDLVVELAARGHRGWIHAVSRHGLLPQTHVPTEPYPPFLAASGGLPRAILQQLALVRAEIARAAEQGIAWQSVIETLRPRVQDLWRVLPPVERKRFLRHLRPYWDIHRHRMAPEIAKRFAALRDSGRVSLSAGRIVDVATTDPLRVSLRPRGHDVVVTLEADWVVNCAGPGAAVPCGDRLVANLLADGRATPDPLGLGLAVAPDCALIEADGGRSRTRFSRSARRRAAPCGMSRPCPRFAGNAPISPKSWRASWSARDFFHGGDRDAGMRAHT